MAITDTLATIKDYFLNWHRNNYATLHTMEIDEVTEELPKANYLVHSGAIKRADDSIRNDFALADEILQKQIDGITGDSSSTSGLIDSKLDKNAEAKASPIEGIYYANDTDIRGVRPQTLQQYGDGVFSWKDKAELLSLSKWYYCVGGGKKTQTYQYEFASIPPQVKLFVNPALRLVYCYLSYQKFNAWNSDKQTAIWWYADEHIGDILTSETGESRSFMSQIAPITQIWAATNESYVSFGVTDDGQFKFRSSKQVQNPVNLYASMMWFYSDASAYNRWKHV